MNKISVGIDKISFYVPNYYLDMAHLANVRGVDKDKYLEGIGQEKMAVLPPNEDVVTMGASAGLNIIENEKSCIDLLIFATESAIDQSKAGGIYIHELLGLNKRCRTMEVKQACYSSTAALRFAINHVKANTKSSALVIASDNARYGIGTAGEPTQGCGAVAMLIKANPAIMSLDDYAGFLTKDVMDFWRPNYRDEAIVDGKFSTKMYLSSLLETWQEYKKISGRTVDDHHKFCYHLPFSKMGKKAHKKLCNLERIECDDNALNDSLFYNKIIGNCYTGSLYLSLISLLENSNKNLCNKRIGMFAYGSGCVAEFFSGIVSDGYCENLFVKRHKKMLDKRVEIDSKTYEKFYNFQCSGDGGNLELDKKSTSSFIFSGINDHKRIYLKNG